MKKKEKKELLALLEDGEIESAIAYVKSCTGDYYNNRETAKERNQRWALSCKDVLAILDLEVGESLIVKEVYKPRGTVSSVAAYAYPDRKYKMLNVDKESYLVARVK